MKKVLLIIAFVLILVAVPVTLLVVKQRQEIRQRAAPATTLDLEPSTKTVQVGDTFTLDVVLDTNNQNRAAAAEINLTFNPTFLEGVSFAAGDLMPFVLAEGQVGNGTATIIVGSQSAGGQGGGVSGRGTIAVLTLRALQPTGGSPTMVDFASTTQVSGANPEDVGQNILVAGGTRGSSITVAGDATVSPSPSVNPSPETTPTPGTSPTPSASPTDQVTYITQPANGATVTTARPTILGTSFPNADMLLSINTSQIYSRSFTADADGDWSHQVDQDLANGTYTITVTGTSGNKEETDTATFTVAVGGAGGTDIASPSPSTTAQPGASETQSGEEVPVTGNEFPTLIMLGTALILILVGGKALLFP